MHQKNSAQVDGGLSGGSRVRRPMSEDPHRRERISLMSMEGQAEGLTYADPGARPPIGVSATLFIFSNENINRACLSGNGGNFKNILEGLVVGF